MNTRELSADRTRRHRAAGAPVWPASLPALDVDERELLVDWLRGSADTRRWQALLEVAGAARIELAARLADKALAAGLCTLKESFERGRWQRSSLLWVELEALQAALGLPTQSQRDARRQALADRLAALMDDALAGEAAQGLAESRMAVGLVEARAALLEALRGWVGEALVLGTWLTASDGRLTMQRRFQLRRAGDGVTLMRGRWTLICIEISSGKPRRMPPEFLAVYEAAIVRENTP